MRYQLMAIYRGLAFEAGVGPTDGDVVLFAAGPPPEELQFEPVAGQWRRQVSRSELDALWESRPVGRYGGHGCLVLDDLGDRLHIAFQGHDAYQAEQLGYWQVDRGVYEVVVPRHDVTDLTERRDDHPPRWAAPAPSAGAAETFGAPATQPGLMPATAPATPVTTPPGPMPAEIWPTSLPGPAPAEAAVPAGPLPAPPGPLPSETLASLSPQPQRPMPPEQAGARGPAAQEPAAQEPEPQEPAPQEPEPQDLAAQDPEPQDPALQGPAAQEPHLPEPASPPQGSTGQQLPWAGSPTTTGPETGAAPPGPWIVSQESRTASPGPWDASQEIRTGRQPAPGSPQQPPVPDTAAASDQQTVPVPSPRIRSSLPADMMAPAPPREPPVNGTGRWHPWVPEPDLAGSWESGAAASRTNGTNGWNGWNHSSSGGSAGRSGPDSQAGTPSTSSRGHGDTAQRDRADTRSIFKDLVALAAIPGGSFAIDEDVDGALCLVRTDDGFEVYSSAGNAKHEVRFFDDEESAYFYLFGVLAAEALRSGRLVRRQDE